MSKYLTEVLMGFIRSGAQFELDPEPATEIEIAILHQRNALPMVFEIHDAAKQRKDAASRLVRKAFAAAVLHLGEHEAVAVWESASRKRPGARKGARRPDRDKVLLGFFDKLVSGDLRQDATLPRFLGQFLAEHEPLVYGASAGAIERKVRRLIVKRRRAEAISASFQSPFEIDLDHNPLVAGFGPAKLPPFSSEGAEFGRSRETKTQSDKNRPE